MTQVRRSPSERLPLPVRLSRSVRKVHLLFLASLPLCIISALASVSTATAQEVSSDGSVSTTVTTTDGKNFDINDGTTRGTNLFHSFKEFSVPTGGSANFKNAANIQNIISRVTGPSKSMIDGLIKANGGANLFLLNPAGILFGPNASLKIGGSFLGSTANSFIFENGFEFSATNLQAPPLLTINLPIGLRYGDNPGEIKVQGRGHDINFQDIKQQPRDPVNSSVSGLEVESGKTLALVGGKVSLEGGVLKSSSGRVEIGSVASNGVVSLASVQEGWKLGYESIGSFGDIQFSGRTLLDTSGVGGGSIAVAGKNISLSGESILLAETRGERNGQEISIVGDEISVISSEINTGTFSSGNAGQVKLVANKSILLEDNGGAGANTQQGLGKAGEITVKADSIEVRNQSGLGSSTFNQGDAGRIEVQANSLLIEKNSGFNTSSDGKGNAGEINIAVGNFVIRNNAGLSVDANSTGNGGKINITANSLQISDNVGFSSSTGQGTTGLGGEINLNVAGPVVVQNSVGINSDTKGTGNAGKISIRANSLLISDSSKLNTTTKQGSTGLGGEINVDIAGPLEVRNSSSINSSTSGTGNAGKISIQANSLQISDSSALDTATEQGSIGQAGEINLDIAGPLEVRKDSGINSSTSGTGNAGKISIKANSLRIEDKSGFSNDTEQDSTGQAGEINLDIAGPLQVRKNSGINSNSSGTGNAGKISITANSLLIEDSSGFDSTTNEGSTGQGGEINLNIAGPLVIRNSSGIDSNTSGTGDAGQITVSAESLEISNNSGISLRNLGSGNAGKLNVRAKTITLDNEGRLRVSSTGSGNAGTLEIVADTIRLNNKSQINATTTSGNGGDLTLDVANLLLLRRESFISTSAGTAGTGGDGGNITINSPLIVAFPSENSDITANAFSGSGGKITIRTQGLFGIAPLSRQELERRLNTTDFTLLDPRNLPTSDITAISQQNPSLSGSVNINTQLTDPTRGLFELPETVIDPAEQIAQNPCLRGGGEFIITGRGGFPTDPNKVLSGDNARVDLVKPVASKTSNNSTSTIKQQQPSTSATDKPIVPARGWIFNEKGEVMLVAYDPTKTGVQRETQPSTSSCAVR